MKQNFESENKSVDLMEKISSEFSVAIWKLYNDGSPGDLYMFVKNHRKMFPLLLDINRNTEKYLGFVLDSTLEKIEKDLNYKYALEIWRLLKDIGTLTEEKLGSYIKQYVKERMMFSEETNKKIKERTGIRNPQYSKEFLEEFILDLESQIKDSLHWDIDLNLNKE